MTKELRVAVMGLGPIGLKAMASTLVHRGVRLVAAVDVRDGLQGQDAGTVAGVGPLGVAVCSSLPAAGPSGSADVVVLCTGSHLDSVAGQVLVSSAVRSSLGGGFQLATLPPATVKGKAEPVPVFDVTSEVGGAVLS